MWLECQLAKKRKIRLTDLLNAQLAHFASRPPLGKVALSYGMLTMKQVFEVLSRQTESNLPFGRQAVECGFLTEEQLGLLLLRQVEKATPVSEFLIESGAITRERFEFEVQKLRDSQVAEKQESREVALTS